MSTTPRLFLSPPDVGGRERAYLLAAFDSGWVAPVGPELDAFEKAICAFTNAPNAVALASGTAGLHLALRACGVGRGDRVYGSTFTFAGSVNPIVYEGATPVFIDSDRISWNMDPTLLAETLESDARRGELPKALVLTHLYGQSADLDPILAACARYEIPLIEDAAEALGATYRGQQTGTFGRFGVYSFNGNKIITTSGGGMLVTCEADLATRVRKWSTQSRDPAPHYEHTELGYNYRMSNLLAALGRAQLEGLPEKIVRRRAHFEAYKTAFADIGVIEMMPIASFGEPNYWLTCITLSETSGLTPETLRLVLERHNIESRPLWKPMHLQPLYHSAPRIGGAVSEDLFERGLCLPSGSAMSDAERNRVIDIIRDSLTAH